MDCPIVTGSPVKIKSFRKSMLDHLPLTHGIPVKIWTEAPPLYET